MELNTNRRKQKIMIMGTTLALVVLGFFLLMCALGEQIGFTSEGLRWETLSAIRISLG